MSNPSPRLVFYHIPRTAGLSLIRDVLSPNFNWWRRCHVVYDQNMKPLGRAQEPLSWPAWRRRQIRLLAGHMPFGFASHFPGASEYFTFLRDPVERAVSDYYFCRRDPANEAHAAAYGASFPSEEKMFAAALKNLETDFVRRDNGRIRPFCRAVMPAVRLETLFRRGCAQEQFHARGSAPVAG